ncbi:MAG TPA: glycosyltransferase [Vicinamibacterales bacterium]|nr:glycosyltransferase [Vicinamibacterales bacterium]HPW20723.1 glycosyltransferase [Vicinamibacterales bacterium]
MRLLVVSTWFPLPPDNGSRLRAYHLLRELGRRHDVTLLSFRGEGRPTAGQEAALRESCRAIDTVPDGAFAERRLTARGLLSPVPRSYAQAFSADMAARIRAAAPGHDAVVALQVTAAFHARAAAKRLPGVFEEAELAVIRDAAGMETSAARRLRRRATWLKYSRFVRSLCRRFAVTTVVSEAEREILAGIGCDPRALKVVPNGVAAADLEWPASRRCERLIYPGSLTYAANADAVRWFLASILPLIDAARPGVEFLVTGSSDGVEAADWQGHGRMTLTGHLPDVRPAVAESAVCVVPLRIGGGTRLKILQAMALGTPVVSTSKGAEGLAVTPGRDILIGDSPDQFAAHVLRLLADAELGTRLAAAARDLVRERYTWERSGERLHEAVAEAVSAWRVAGR